MPVAHLIHGFVGSGKTTYAKKLEKERSALRFSVDDWLTILYGQNPPSDKFEECHGRVTSLIWQVSTQALLLGQDIILDFGFWSRSSRDDARHRVRKAGAEAVFYEVTCAEDVMKTRTLSRTEKMPEGALYIDENVLNTLKDRFEPLGADEPHVTVRTDEEPALTTAPLFSIRQVALGQAATLCEPILRLLPEWFGIESAITNYVEAIDKLPTLVAEKGEQPVGFLTIKQHNKHAAEIYVMAVHPDFHRLGIGQQLVEAAEQTLCDLSVEYLQVKTLGVSHPDQHYAATRAFYGSVGFKPVEEFTELWPENPCLQMIKRLPVRTR